MRRLEDGGARCHGAGNRHRPSGIRAPGGSLPLACGHSVARGHRGRGAPSAPVCPRTRWRLSSRARSRGEGRRTGSPRGRPIPRDSREREARSRRRRGRATSKALPLPALPAELPVALRGPASGRAELRAKIAAKTLWRSGDPLRVGDAPAPSVAKGVPGDVWRQQRHDVDVRVLPTVVSDGPDRIVEFAPRPSLLKPVELPQEVVQETLSRARTCGCERVEVGSVAGSLGPDHGLDRRDERRRLFAGGPERATSVGLADPR